MAIQVLKEKRTVGERWGTGLGEGLQLLAEQKLEELQKKEMFKSLLGANVPENVATAVVNAPKSLQREMFKPLLSMNKDLRRDQIGEKDRGLSGLHNLRKQLLDNMKNNQIQPDVMREELSRLGIMPEEVNVLLGTELNDDIVRYFLDKTNNDPKKARKLAKKFGYKV